uniref:Uncharacterized protein n=1 Tax=Pipistrellus kuhlii TaxID=59472 RepID=A0A7J7X075_PIPKU|nr:hypothetical protein mPipKuh1_010754 [Pipistrellus kuhlii]
MVGGGTAIERGRPVNGSWPLGGVRSLPLIWSAKPGTPTRSASESEGVRAHARCGAARRRGSARLSAVGVGSSDARREGGGRPTRSRDYRMRRKKGGQPGPRGAARDAYFASWAAQGTRPLPCVIVGHLGSDRCSITGNQPCFVWSWHF